MDESHGMHPLQITQKGDLFMKNNITELVFILDRSGSMCGMEADTVGGFNATIEKQKKLEGKVYVSTVLFSNDSMVVHDRVDIEKIEPMRVEDFSVGGCTALLDAVGGAIHHIGNVHKYAREEDVPAHTIFVIITDGMENCSKSYTTRRVREMIERQTERYGWEFLFLAANIDAFEAAQTMGIREDRAANYRQTREGTSDCYDAVERFCCSIRCETPVSDEWRKEL